MLKQKQIIITKIKVDELGLRSTLACQYRQLQQDNTDSYGKILPTATWTQGVFVALVHCAEKCSQTI